MNTSATFSLNKVTIYGMFNNSLLFTIPADSSYCYTRVPSAMYCGTALNVPVNIVVTTPFTFVLNIDPMFLPCAITGYYVVSAAFGNVMYAVGSSTCSDLVVYNNITYGKNPSSLTLTGLAASVGFTFTMTETQCTSTPPPPQ